MSVKLRMLLLVVGLALPVDQLSKLLTESRLVLGERVPIVDGLLYIVHARNPGAAFGLFGSADTALRTGIFAAASLLAILLIAAFYRRVAPGDRVQSLGLSLILSGASGNFIDRIWRGEVVDFLHVRVWPGYAWPDFNIADVCIVVGVLSLMMDLLTREAVARALPGGRA